jgi:hypothetical protein
LLKRVGSVSIMSTSLSAKPPTRPRRRSQTSSKGASHAAIEDMSEMRRFASWRRCAVVNLALGASAANDYEA